MNAVELRNVSKVFMVSHDKPALVRELVPRLLRSRRVEPHWALRNLDVQIVQGTCVGLIGPNGAGKTTFLNIIAGILQPTTGTVSVQGVVVPLLSLGGGFHPELSGLENIFLNGALLGMATREIRRKLDAIVAFSQLDGFIDAPMQTYSAGMQMRLGFAIAVHAEGDMLLIDEVMAVGDQAFQVKCLERLHLLKQQGKTLIVSAHSLSLFEHLTDRTLLLHHGAIIADGTIEHVQRRYAALTQWLASTQEPLSSASRCAIDEQVEHHETHVIQRGWGTRLHTEEAEIQEVQFLDAHEQQVSAVNSGEPLTISVRCAVGRTLHDPHIGIAIFRDDATYCYGPNTRFDGLQFATLHSGTYECRVRVTSLALVPGRYVVSVAIWDTDELAPYAYQNARHSFEIIGASAQGVVQLDHEWRKCPASLSSAILDITVEGPAGRQAWFRTFEPLTLTLTLPPQEYARTLRAECRGPQGQLWWISDYHLAPAPRGQGQRHTLQLRFPQLALLTGRYEWRFRWEVGSVNGEAPATLLTCPIEVIADRGDHGIVYLPHQWSLDTCQRPAESPILNIR